MLDSMWLETILFSNVVSLLTMQFSLLFHLFQMFSFLSSLSFNPFVFLNPWEICIWILFLICKWMSCRFKCSHTKFIFTRAFKRFILNHFVFIRFCFFSIFDILSSKVFFKIICVAVLNDNMSTNCKLFVINI